MVKRQIVVFLLTSVLLLLGTAPALAGGWVLVTLDEVPHNLRAGETVTLGFTVRQHGIHPVNLANVVLTATGPAGESLAFNARQAGAEGHYLVDVTLPNAGDWVWEIKPDWFPTIQLAPISVIDPPASTSRAPNPQLSQWIARIGTLVMNLFLGVDKETDAIALPLARVAQPVIYATTTEMENEVAYGRAIFMAKGCNTCHLHGAALNRWSIAVGPNLTGYQLPADYLRAWLKDPQAIKPQTKMPNLALKAEEIEALIAFLPSVAQ